MYVCTSIYVQVYKYLCTSIYVQVYKYTSIYV